MSTPRWFTNPFIIVPAVIAILAAILGAVLPIVLTGGEERFPEVNSGPINATKGQLVSLPGKNLHLVSEIWLIAKEGEDKFQLPLRKESEALLSAAIYNEVEDGRYGLELKTEGGESIATGLEILVTSDPPSSAPSPAAAAVPPPTSPTTPTLTQVSDIEVVPGKAIIQSGQNKVLVAVATHDGRTVNDGKVTWISSHKGVATVSSEGPRLASLKGEKVGNANILAVLEGTHGTMNVKVTPHIDRFIIDVKNDPLTPNPDRSHVISEEGREIIVAVLGNVPWKKLISDLFGSQEIPIVVEADGERLIDDARTLDYDKEQTTYAREQVISEMEKMGLPSGFEWAVGITSSSPDNPARALRHEIEPYLILSGVKLRDVGGDTMRVEQYAGKPILWLKWEESD